MRNELPNPAGFAFLSAWFNATNCTFYSLLPTLVETGKLARLFSQRNEFVGVSQVNSLCHPCCKDAFDLLPAVVPTIKSACNDAN